MDATLSPAERATDAERRASQHTGVDWDAELREYEVWLGGRIVGWTSTSAHGWRVLREQVRPA